MTSLHATGATAPLRNTTSEGPIVDRAKSAASTGRAAIEGNGCSRTPNTRGRRSRGGAGNSLLDPPVEFSSPRILRRSGGPWLAVRLPAARASVRALSYAKTSPITAVPARD